MRNAAVTALMPVCDPPLPMLEKSIESVIAQTFGDFEFLILNDGNDGGTDQQVRERLNSWAARESRIRIAHEPHRGVPATLNRGLEMANSEYIARHDAGHWSEPPRLARQGAFLKEHPEVSLVGADTYSHKADGTPLWRLRPLHSSGELARALWLRIPFVHGSTLYCRDQALAIGGYRKQLPGSADYDFLWRLTETGSAVNLDEFLYHSRDACGSVSPPRTTDQTRSYRAAHPLARARRRGELEVIPAALAAAADSPDPVRTALKQAGHFMLAGDFSSARHTCLHLLGENPTRALAWAKTLRFAVFHAFPGLRESCFRLVRPVPFRSASQEVYEELAET